MSFKLFVWVEIQNENMGKKERKMQNLSLIVIKDNKFYFVLETTLCQFWRVLLIMHIKESREKIMSDFVIVMI